MSNWVVLTLVALAAADTCNDVGPFDTKLFQIVAANVSAARTSIGFNGSNAGNQCNNPVCGTNKFCVGFEPDGNIYCYGGSSGCLWNSNNCNSDADCARFDASSPKYTDGGTPACPASGWHSDACTCDCGSTNLALYGTAEQSSTYTEGFNRQASICIDGSTCDNSDSCVCLTNEGGEQWWQLDLGTTVDVAEVEIFAALHYPLTASLILCRSLPCHTGTAAMTRTMNVTSTAESDSFKLQFGCASMQHDVRYIKVQRDDGNQIRMREVRVFGAPTGPPTASPTPSPSADPTAAPTADPTASPTEDPTAAPTASPTSSPTADPTAAPTEDPTAAPTASPTPTGTADPMSAPPEVAGGLLNGGQHSEVVPKAVGDPHMTNIHGERFDIMRPGAHVLVQIPRGAAPASSLLRMEADVQALGQKCADMYIQTLNVTGSWAESEHEGGLTYHSGQVGTPWRTLGRVDVKVAPGRTTGGALYLNVLVRHLSRAGYPVGGLLGEDDHTAAATPHRGCRKAQFSLYSPTNGLKLEAEAEGLVPRAQAALQVGYFPATYAD